MAASSPALSNNSTDTTTTAATATATTSPSPSTTGAANISLTPTTNASKNLRGLNKPKCIKCGNVARSRCPYQSCKSCCAKAQNPCHIHVLKGNSTLAEKTSSSSSPLFDQQSNEASPSGGSLRVASSLRQLSNNFAQFNNLQSPLRSRKPLTRKDATVINEWRFLKLKENRDRNIEIENEAFDRYMQNVHLLEEVFSTNPTPEGPTEDESPTSNPNPTPAADNSDTTISGLKLRLRSNVVRSENFRKRIKEIVDQGLRKLRKLELSKGGNDINEQDELAKTPKKFKTRQEEKDSALIDLIDKLNKARNEEDLKACLELKAHIFNLHAKTSQAETEDTENRDQETANNNPSHKQPLDYFPPKWFSTTTIGQDDLNRVDARFCSLEEIEDL